MEALIEPPQTPTAPGLPHPLLDAVSYDHPVESIRHIETHISHILLCGTYAYKIKKPLNLGFLDFSTPNKRLNACQEEVRLNQRLAPHIYLGVVPITGTPDQPHVNGPGQPFEYAVKMRQFDSDATLDRIDAAGKLTSTQIETIGSTIARFHQQDCARADLNNSWGDPDQIWQPVAQNFIQLFPQLTRLADRKLLEALQQWSESEHLRLTPFMAQRKRDGFVRECHGDLHLGNLAWVDQHLLVFDCLEFNPELRWIDIQSEIAFCVMDLMQRGHMNLAWLLINTWLEQTGDYAGMALLRYYAVYRALVRAKVAILRAAQGSGPEQDAATTEVQQLLALAVRLTLHPWPLRLDITHGLSGSGKSTITRTLMQIPGAIRLRSDIERKRMAGIDALASSQSAVGQNLYSPDSTQQTYHRLNALAGKLLDAGWPVVVDATFLARWQRDLLYEQALTHGVPFHILDFQVPIATLRDRIQKRVPAGRDASEAGLDVLQHQLDTEQALTSEEQDHVTPINATLHLRI